MHTNNPVYGQGYQKQSDERSMNDPWHDRYNKKIPIPPRHSLEEDSHIWEDVCDALNNAFDIDASEMEVDVENAIVYLHGVVKSGKEAWRAEEIAWDIPGVNKVKNEIDIKYF